MKLVALSEIHLTVDKKLKVVEPKQTFECADAAEAEKLIELGAAKKADAKEADAKVASKKNDVVG